MDNTDKHEKCIVCGEPLDKHQTKYCSVVCDDVDHGHPYPGHETWPEEDDNPTDMFDDPVDNYPEEQNTFLHGE